MSVLSLPQPHVGGRRRRRRRGDAEPPTGSWSASAGAQSASAGAQSASAAALSPRLWAWPGYVVLGAGFALNLVAPAAVAQARYAPLVASLVICGLPHGAVDHLVPGWVRGRAFSPHEMGRFLAAYLVLTLALIPVWFIAPVLALVGFFAVTVLHWGWSELAWFPAQRRPALVAAARGMAAVFLPALAFPARFNRAVHALLMPFMAHPPRIVPTGTVEIVGLALFATVCLLGLGESLRARLELLGVVVFFATVDPVFAVGLYFIAWHSWRHLVRLATIDPVAAAALAERRPVQAILRVLGAAIPCTLAALLGLLGFAALAAVRLSAPAQITAVALALIAALTVPHTILVAWLDRRR